MDRCREKKEEAEKAAELAIKELAFELVHLLRDDKLPRDEFRACLERGHSFNLGMLFGLMMFLPINARACVDLETLLFEIDSFLFPTETEKEMKFRLERAEQIEKQFGLERSD